jgi:hypothetical protein
MKRKETYYARKAGDCGLFHNRGIIQGYCFVADRKAWNAMSIKQRREKVKEFIQLNGGSL